MFCLLRELPIYDIRTEGEGWGGGKADEVRKASKGGCAKMRTRRERGKARNFADVIKGSPLTLYCSKLFLTFTLSSKILASNHLSMYPISSMAKEYFVDPSSHSNLGWSLCSSSPTAGIAFGETAPTITNAKRNGAGAAAKIPDSFRETPQSSSPPPPLSLFLSSLARLPDGKI